MSAGLSSIPGRLALLVLTGLLVGLPACDSTPSASSGGPVSVDTRTPEGLLSSLQAAADRSLNDYYAALRSVTDCEALPDVCRLLTARESAAREMMLLRGSMVREYGSEGDAAATMMIRSAFLGQFEEIQRASVFSGSGDVAVLRVGTSVYRLRLRDGAWTIVRFPDPPYDPAASADAIEILVERVDAIRKDVESGRIPSMTELERRIELATGA
ncbi:MAG: hypothetical protein CMJ34_09480 [Phycisphaerae bacterium]|nr:hypothetical protein [Phycisphaerae bacterium]